MVAGPDKISEPRREERLQGAASEGEKAVFSCSRFLIGYFVQSARTGMIGGLSRCLNAFWKVRCLPSNWCSGKNKCTNTSRLSTK